MIGVNSREKKSPASTVMDRDKLCCVSADVILLAHNGNCRGSIRCWNNDTKDGRGCNYLLQTMSGFVSLDGV